MSFRQLEVCEGNTSSAVDAPQNKVDVVAVDHSGLWLPQNRFSLSSSSLVLSPLQVFLPGLWVLRRLQITVRCPCALRTLLEYVSENLTGFLMPKGQAILPCLRLPALAGVSL